jgi:hypothetical protein
MDRTISQESPNKTPPKVDNFLLALLEIKNKTLLFLQRQVLQINIRHTGMLFVCKLETSLARVKI